ncbi:MAG: hypothetical protein P8X89_18860 [Reinekea sp.]
MACALRCDGVTDSGLMLALRNDLRFGRGISRSIPAQGNNRISRSAN